MLLTSLPPELVVYILCSCMTTDIYSVSVVNVAMNRASEKRRRKMKVLMDAPFYFNSMRDIAWNAFDVKKEIDNKSINIFSSAIACGALPHLKNLNMKGIQLSDANMISFSSAISRGVLLKLEILKLGANRFGDVGVSALAVAFSSGALGRLSKLYLYRNQIGDAGITALAEAIRSRTLSSLDHLDFGHGYDILFRCCVRRGTPESQKPPSRLQRDRRCWHDRVGRRDRQRNAGSMYIS